MEQLAEFVAIVNDSSVSINCSRGPYFYSRISGSSIIPDYLNLLRFQISNFKFVKLTWISYTRYTR